MQTLLTELDDGLSKSLRHSMDRKNGNLKFNTSLYIYIYLFKLYENF